MQFRKKPIIDLDRRLLLKGAGGFAVGMPILPSLMTTAWAADPVFVRRPRFVALTTDHGGVKGSNMHAPDSMLTATETLAGAHSIARGALTATRSGATASLSPVMSAASSVLTDKLLGKMNVLRGFDITFGIMHNVGGHLGNFAGNDGNAAEGVAVQAHPMPTIDAVMAYSSAFYPDLSRIRDRIIQGGNKHRVSWNYASPTTKSGGIVGTPTIWGNQELFNRIFVPDSPQPMTSRPPVVDKVRDYYNLVARSNRRLSAADKQRLADHMEMLAEVERRIAAAPPPASCSGVKKPGDSNPNNFGSQADSIAYHKGVNDVIVAAFMCGTSRIAINGSTNDFVDYTGDWHNSVAHQFTSPGPQQLLTNGLHNFFESCFVDLASKLDVEEAPGMTYLDNTLVQWTQECSSATHESNGLTVLTAGSACGFFKTGLYCDYRNKAGGTTAGDYYGLPYNRWLGSVLQAMGVPRAEYETGGMKGYGYLTFGGAFAGKYSQAVLDSLGEVVPMLKA